MSERLNDKDAKRAEQQDRAIAKGKESTDNNDSSQVQAQDLKQNPKARGQ